MKELILKKGEERRLKMGHLWVFSNEVDTRKSNLKDFEPGEPVRIISGSGQFIGNGYVNPNCLICARIVSRKSSQPLDTDLIKYRIRQALVLRERLFDKPFYRLMFAEGDFLPGVICDRFGDVLSLQITTAGMERMKDEIMTVLAEETGASSILLKNDSGGRKHENLPSYVQSGYGMAPEEVEMEENGAKFVIPLVEGQKTGWFYDMRVNRRELSRFANGARVLDLFSYVGGLGVTSALYGAKESVCVDASELALSHAKRSAELNGFADRVETRVGDVFEVMDQLKADGRKFDVICCDPPAFMKNKKDIKRGEQAYIKVNREAMKLLEDGGILMSCSCSQHMVAEEFRKVLVKAATQKRARIQIFSQGHQGPDHPIQPAMHETNYLKSYTMRVMK